MLLAVGLVRWEDDAEALASAWAGRAHRTGAAPGRPLTLRPLGELAVAVTPAGEQEWITPHLKEAENLIEELGGLGPLAASLRWYECTLRSSPTSSRRRSDMPPRCGTPLRAVLTSPC